MEKQSSNLATQLTEGLCSFLRRCICAILSAGSFPRHVAFIMDGNRRYAMKQGLLEGDGHRVGFSALMNMLKYCYEMNVKYVTVYAFSIENFKRRPEEVQSTMQLIHEKIESLLEKESIVNQYGVRVHFIGNLKLLSKPVRLAAERAINATAHNSRAVLAICIAYTSTDEIAHSVEETCKEKWDELGGNATDSKEPLIDVADVEKHMYMAVAPDPDIIIRSSGETRLSNFLLWQSASSLLYSPRALWPEIGFWHLIRAILDFQRNLASLETKLKQS
ncbi:dehydrodolichyl diphosphate synthase CPT3-like isoform X1 [Salvia miltiorrhiza]|uniref:dehydrodolichyl diphosphate synthase CPT3-like isoform X1 n=2 Tax=Salvia miltiorrhiza TaxID=226208 RepID=UPI0025ACE9C5|nr:dehydrodolichyl diphosphate synthase CPT3-like isoform X1 [Salvia miltiorrhiza]XP_057791745.1 dehydrodolichyl diphosphate synthase CPT3-like isoform X1 [Salvia miltiorrhiza]